MSALDCVACKEVFEDTEGEMDKCYHCFVLEMTDEEYEAWRKKCIEEEVVEC